MNMNMNPNSELQQSVVSVPDLVQVPEDLLNQAKEFQEAIMMYSCAIREVKTKLEVLNDDLSIRNQRNPIEVIKSRVKKPRSIVEKLHRRNLPITLDSMVNHLDDVAGIRVICSFVDDIYNVARMLVSQDDIRVIAVKDYIEHPKPNGYRSYHLIVEVPVFFSDRKKDMRVEVQIRTIAMDFWASLDHQLKYKKDIGTAADEIGEELRKCAEVIAKTDRHMLIIRKSIEAQSREGKS
ncbi:MAG: GTP pyrophosphokinase family protein [Lachnospiraceae bacterium]|nr:GTP pyrophosphokinase family protein [Lachnospiraceae bacterium]